MMADYEFPTEVPQYQGPPTPKSDPVKADIPRELCICNHMHPPVKDKWDWFVPEDFNGMAAAIALSGAFHPSYDDRPYLEALDALAGEYGLPKEEVQGLVRYWLAGKATRGKLLTKRPHNSEEVQYFRFTPPDDGWFYLVPCDKRTLMGDCYRYVKMRLEAEPQTQRKVKGAGGEKERPTLGLPSESEDSVLPTPESGSTPQPAPEPYKPSPGLQAWIDNREKIRAEYEKPKEETEDEEV